MKSFYRTDSSFSHCNARICGGLGYSHYKDSKSNTDVASKETQTSNKNTHEDTTSQGKMQNQVNSQTNEVSNRTSTKTLSEKQSS